VAAVIVASTVAVYLKVEVWELKVPLITKGVPPPERVQVWEEAFKV
jgi:hypothetical protein